MATTIARRVDALNWGSMEWTQAFNGVKTPEIPDNGNWFRNPEATDIIKRLYLHEGENIDAMFRRVAQAVSISQDHGVDVYKGLCRGDFCFSTPIMMNATKAHKFHSAACFILPIEDSLDSIMETAKIMSQIYRRGGGVGINLTPLRPEGALTSSGGKAGGPVQFLEMFQGVGKAMFSGGKARKAAFLGALDFYHPDADKFIFAKDKTGKLNEMNLSVRVKKEDIGTKRWANIVRNAWECGDPGVIFTDNQDNESRVMHLGTCGNNPCTEFVFPISEGAACNLGSINLINFLGWGSEEPEKRLRKAVRTLFIALDKVIDVSVYPTQQIQLVMESLRPVGLGFTGLARLLMRGKIRYGSTEAVEYTRNLAECIQEECEDTSRWLKTQHPMQRLYKGEPVEYYMVRSDCRNAVMTTVAPTGTISWVMGAEGSFGIEPVFALKSKKTFTTGDKRTIDVLIPEYEDYLKSLDLRKTYLPENDPDYFKCTANELTVDEHLNMVAAVQDIIDMSVSKTINLPNSATLEDVDNVFRKAHALGLKGVTVYRDGCKNEQVMTLAGSSKQDAGQSRSPEVSVPNPAPAPKHEIPVMQQGRVHRVKAEGGTLYVHVYKDEEGQIRQVFLTYDKPGESTYALTSALGRIISIGLQHNVPVEAVVSTLKDIYSSLGGGFHHFAGKQKGTAIKSVPDAIASVLAYECSTEPRVSAKDDAHGKLGSQGHSPFNADKPGKRCPQCEEYTVYKIDGCEHCSVCNWTKGCG